MTDHALTLGSLPLTDGLPDDDHGYTLKVVAQGTSFGVAEGVREIVTSLLADGDLVRTTRFGNREVRFAVDIIGPDLASLAHGEAALRREVGRGNMLTWQAPDDLAPATVFDVIDSSMAQTFDDLDELLRGRRTFEITLTCAPFARSADPVTVPALEVGGGAQTVVDTCDSATGWTGTRSGSSVAVAANFWDPSSVGVGELTSEIESPERWTMTRTGTVNFAGAPYLVVQARTTAFLPNLTAYANATGTGSPLPLLSVRQIDSGRSEYVFQTAGGTVSALTFAHTSPAEVAWQVLIVHQVAKTGRPPGQTARQVTRIIEAGGTERTPASIHVQSTTGVDGLGGLVMVHTSPEDGSGYSPPLRRWRTSASTGPEYADANALSGKWEDIAYLAGGFYAEVPTSALPEGGYVLMARLRSATADLNQATLFWSTSTIFPDTTTQQGFTNGNIKIALGATPTIFPVAALTLPSVRTKAGRVQIVLQVSNTTGPQVQLDDAWLFRADDDCALTIVNNWHEHLWLDSPDATSPVPRVWIGDGRDIQAHPGEALAAMGAHVLNPDGTAVFTAAMSDYPATAATFYRRWHSNAAE